MKIVKFAALLVAAVSIWSCTGRASDDSASYQVTQVPFTDVKIAENSFWGDRLKAARALTEKYECAAVLKSDVSVICGKEGGELKYYLNTVGTPALAKGGSGDALTGILAAVMGEDGFFLDDAALACLWHGMAGVVGEEKFGQRELTTDQLISCLHEAEQWGKS